MAGCVHHWILDNQNFGICKKCGAERQFGGNRPSKQIAFQTRYARRTYGKSMPIAGDS